MKQILNYCCLLYNILPREICGVSYNPSLVPFFRKKSGVRLYTCAIRPAAIYGPGEERHLPRILSLAKMGLLSFKVGNSSLKTDWVYVDNLVLSLILASMGLLDDIPDRKHPIAAGQAYFISDGNVQTITTKPLFFLGFLFSLCSIIKSLIWPLLTCFINMQAAIICKVLVHDSTLQ